MKNSIRVECHNCGKEFDKPTGEYNRSEKKGMNHFCSLSCSCSYKNKVYPPKGDVSRLIPNNRRDEFTEFRYFVRKARVRDKKKDRLNSMDLDLQYIKDLWVSQDGKCAVTGEDLILPSNSEGWPNNNPYNASLDRIDNSIGYVKGNVRFVAHIANIARGPYTDEELKVFCKKVVKLAEFSGGWGRSHSLKSAPKQADNLAKNKELRTAAIADELMRRKNNS